MPEFRIDHHDPPSEETLRALGNAVGSLHHPEEFVSENTLTAIGDSSIIAGVEYVMHKGSIVDGSLFVGAVVESEGHCQVGIHTRDERLAQDPIQKLLTIDMIKEVVVAHSSGEFAAESWWAADLLEYIKHKKVGALGKDLVGLSRDAPHSILRTRSRSLSLAELASGTALAYTINTCMDPIDGQPTELMQRSVELHVPTDDDYTKYRLHENEEGEVTLWQAHPRDTMSAYTAMVNGLHTVGETKTRFFTRELLAVQLEIDMNTLT